MKIDWMQLLRVVMMVLAVAGIIYALEYMDHGFAVWFWVGVLGVGLVGLLYTFRISRLRARSERRAAADRERKRSRRRR